MPDTILDDNGNEVGIVVLDDYGNEIVEPKKVEKATGGYKIVEVRPGQFMSVKEGETVEQTQGRIQNRPDARVIGGIPEFFEEQRLNKLRAVEESTILPEWLKPAASMFESLSLEPARFLAEGLAEPEGLIATFPGLLKRGLTPRAITPEVLPPEPVVPRGLLPAPGQTIVGRDRLRAPSVHEIIPDKDRILTGPGGAQRAGVVTPQETARLMGTEIGPEGPIGIDVPHIKPGVDLGELAEAERLAGLKYTEFEHTGGVPLVLPDRPMMDIPPTAGDTRLGFESASRGDLPYPLNVVPEAVRPRSAQTITRALAGDEFAKPVLPSEEVTFVSPKPDAPKPIEFTRDLKGGTAAIEPGERILPSAVKTRARANTGGLKVEKAVETAPPVVKEGVKEFVSKAADDDPSIMWKSIYTQLDELGPYGTELKFAFQRAAQHRAEYDAMWTEPLFEIGKKLKKSEFENFGAYVEGIEPIPNERVQKAVDAWVQAQNLIGDTAVAKKLNIKRGDEIIPFQKIDKDYWPRIPDGIKEKQDIVDKLVSQGMTRYEAMQVAKHWENTGEILLRPQHSRMGKVFQYRNDFDVAIHHGRTMSKRIANHENLGAKDVAGKYDQGIADLIEDTASPNLAVVLAKRLAGRDGLPSERLVNGLNTARKAMSLTSLPNFTLPNVITGQGMNAFMAVMSKHPVAATKEIMKLFGSQYRDSIRASGAFNSFNRTLLEELSGTDPFKIGAGEKINRAVAAAIGKSTVREAFTDYVANPADVSAKYFLETLLSRNADEVTAITPELEKFAAGRMAEITQGLNNPGNLPYHWSHPVNSRLKFAAQLALIFKKVGFQTTKTVKDTIMAQPTAAGKAKAIAAWAAISQVAGEMVGDVKSGLTGKERPEDMWRVLDNWGNAFMLGLPWEMVTSAQYGPTAALGAAFGPVASKGAELSFDTTKTIKNLWNEEEDPFRPLIEFGKKNLPLPGRERLRGEE